MSQPMRYPLFMLITLLLFSSTSRAEELYSEQEVYVSPSLKSAVSGTIKQGNVAVLARRGFWVKIKSGDTLGWTKLSNLKMQESLQWMGPIDTLHDTGRIAGSKSTTTVTDK
ncbi:MAG: hypothetical protein R8K50_03935 [Mariprofundus sp.]